MVNPGKWALTDYAPKQQNDQGRVANEYEWDRQPRQLMAVEADSGKVLWKQEAICAPITLGTDGKSVVFYDGSQVQCLDAATGRKQWASDNQKARKLIEYNFGPRVLIHQNVVLYAGGDGVERALDLATGKQLWEGSHEKSGYRSPEDLIVAGGLVWNAGTTQGKQTGEFTGRNPVTGELVSGPETLSQEELDKNAGNLWADVSAHPLDDQYYADRSAHWDKIQVPLLSSGNWGGHGLHLRGNTEGYLRAASKQKWLEIHGWAHWTHFYSNYGIALQKRFLGYFLKGEDTGWSRQPPVQLQLRSPGEVFELRHENEWPIARTQWTKFYLDAANKGLGPVAPAAESTLAFEALGDGLMFMTAPFTQKTEITGPVAAKLFASSSTTDADFFLALRLFDPQGKEVLFHGANDPRTPIALGWLRASHRKLDPKLSQPYQPYHSHTEVQPLQPGVPVELDVEIWPTCIVIPAGYRLGLWVRGKDYDHGGPPLELSGVKYPMQGVGPFKHDEPSDRPVEIFGGTTTLYFRKDCQPYVLLPVIPPKQ